MTWSSWLLMSFTRHHHNVICYGQVTVTISCRLVICPPPLLPRPALLFSCFSSGIVSVEEQALTVKMQSSFSKIPCTMTCFRKWLSVCNNFCEHCSGATNVCLVSIRLLIHVYKPTARRWSALTILLTWPMQIGLTPAAAVEDDGCDGYGDDDVVDWSLRDHVTEMGVSSVTQLWSFS